MGRVGFDNVLVASYTDLQNITGLTAFLFPQGATGAAVILGGGTGTRGFDSLHPERTPTPIFAFTVTGGSAMGLDSNRGVMEYLRERGWGLRIDSVKVPTVASAVIFDLFVGNAVAPSVDGVYEACKNASSVVQDGSYGAGTGAVVGKLLTVSFGTKGGQAYLEREVFGMKVGCFAVVNAFGDVKRGGVILAGARDPKGRGFADTARLLEKGVTREIPGITGQSTTICLVITDAALSKQQAYRVAIMAASGMARVIDPVWTVFDGDIVAVLSVGSKRVDVNVLGSFASRLLENTICKAVESAEGRGGIPSAKELGIAD